MFRDQIVLGEGGPRVDCSLYQTGKAKDLIESGYYQNRLKVPFLLLVPVKKNKKKNSTPILTVKSFIENEEEEALYKTLINFFLLLNTSYKSKQLFKVKQN